MSSLKQLMAEQSRKKMDGLKFSFKHRIYGWLKSVENERIDYVVKEALKVH